MDKEAYSRAVDGIVAILKDAIVGCYLYGSIVEAGLRPDSDIDLLVVLSRPLTSSERRTIVRSLLLVSGAKAVQGPARPLEVTFVLASDISHWHYPPRNQLVYGEWLRDRLEKGDIPEPGVDPDLAILLHGVRKNGRALIGPEAAAIVAPVPHRDIHRAIMDSLPGLLASLIGDEGNVILTLARMWTTLATDEIVPKDVAATWVIDRIPQEHKAVLAAARAAYLGETSVAWRHWQHETALFVDHAAAQIQGLYERHYPADAVRSS